MPTKSLKCVIIDDERDSISTLNLLLDRIEANVEVIGEASSVDQANEILSKNEVDFIFLDIEMPGKNGFELLNTPNGRELNVVVISGYERHALQALKLSVIDYLLKPIGLLELQSAITKVQESIGKDIKPKNDRLMITTNSGFTTLHFEDIISIEGVSGNYSKFKMNNGHQTISTKPLNKIEQELDPDQFFMISRGLIINLNFISAFKSKLNTIHLSDNSWHTVAVRRKKEFKEAYHSFLENKRSKDI